MTQLELLEPTGAVVLDLARRHRATSEKLAALSVAYSARGWTATSRALARDAASALDVAEEMEMLAEFEALGGVRS